MLLAALLLCQSLVQPSARIEVLEGRGAVAWPGGVRELDARSSPADVPGPGHLETQPASRATLAWRGEGSWRLRGESICEWSASEAARGGLSWRVLEVAEMSIEVRRGPIRLELPGGWRAELRAGASYLRAAPGGAFELRHDAGLPILLRPPPEDGRPLPALTLLAGARLRIAPERGLVEEQGAGRVLDSHARVDPSERPRVLPPWSSFAWPWRPAAAEARAGPEPAGPRGDPSTSRGAVEAQPLTGDSVAPAHEAEPPPARRSVPGASLPDGAAEVRWWPLEHPFPDQPKGRFIFTPWGLRWLRE